jgi:hypothetical protein
MGTQIFINPDGCRVEYTKISAHSFSFEPELFTPETLFYGGFSSPDGFATWSWPFFNYTNSALAPVIGVFDKSAGIPLPINLVAEDVVTISGTAVFNNYNAYTANGWVITLQVGVNYFNCERPDEIPSFTFIPLESFVLTNPGTVCFETSVTLGSNFDTHETRFLVGFNIIAICPDTAECVNPGVLPPNLAAVSYTFDIQRPCAVNTSESNFIIRNCCEPIITELVNIPGLQVGSFHVDDEGNCWEVISASQDVTNFTRNFVDNYTSCVECQNANPCPLNLKIGSCCVQGQEFVTGSLPGLDVGDTFVDNHGLCWDVSDTTSGPISEESIVVDTIILGGCEDCTTANPCPSFWNVFSCCNRSLKEVIASSVVLNLGDTFVDTNGICWSVGPEADRLPTNYDIVVDTVYTGAVDPETNCDLCITANLCPLEYFLTIRACCDPDRVEVTSLSVAISEGRVFMDEYGICWEVMSYSTTGLVTYPLDSEGIQGIYENCADCVNSGGRRGCPILYQVRDCNTNIVYTAISLSLLTVGSYYPGIYESEQQSCFEVLGYGYPETNPLEIFIKSLETNLATCEECQITIEGNKVVELQPCCGGPNIIASTTLGFGFGPNKVYALGFTTEINGCYLLVGFSTGTPTETVNGIFQVFNTSDCAECLLKYPCS